MNKIKHKICICGHFGGNEKFYDGQTIKTKNVYSAILNNYDKGQIKKIDTYNWKGSPIKFLINFIKGVKDSQNVVILPAHNGIKIFVPLLLLLKRIYKMKILYIVIGGWLPEFLKNKKNLLKKIKKLDKIFVETLQMKEKLQNLGIDNVAVMQNFKEITIVSETELKANITLPLKLCTFSRVCKEKGIEDAIEVVKKINLKADQILCTLDIYGQVDKQYKDIFDKIIIKMPTYINYKGIIEYNNSVDTVKQYDLLLFPTYYEGEGVPGTLIDAMCSGVPIIASNWKYNSEIIKNNFNGYLYEVHNNAQLEKILEEIVFDTGKILKLERNCIEEAEKYKTKNVIKVLLDEIK